jgi:hypothetical protein
MKMNQKNRQSSCLLKIIAAILVQTGTVISSEPPKETVVNIDISPIISQISTQEEDFDCDATEYLSKRYVLLSNEFHRMLEGDGKELSKGRLLFLLSSSRDFEERSARVGKQYWVRQFKVLSTSLQVAIELTEAKADRDAHKAEHEDK